jgi:hypothetical protein
LTQRTHALAVSRPLFVRERREGDDRVLECTGLEHPVAARSDLFQDALDDLVARLGVVPVMCGTCRYAFHDLFSASTGTGPLSCFREAKPLAIEVEARGRSASRAALAHFYRRSVDAFDACSQFEPRPQYGSAGP